MLYETYDQSAHIGQKDREIALQEILFSFHVTPHSSSQIPPQCICIIFDTLYWTYTIK